MPLRNCLENISELHPEMRDAINSYLDKHLKNGLPERQAELKAVEDYAKKINDDVNGLRKKVKLAPNQYIPHNPSEKIKEIEQRYAEQEKQMNQKSATAEPIEENTTGVKKIKSNEVRAANNLPKVDFPKMIPDAEALGKAKERIDKGEVNPQNMVDSILKDKRGYKDESEVMDMQYYSHQLERQSQQLDVELAAAKTPEEEADIRQRKLQLSDLRDAQTEAALTAGNQWGKIGNRMVPVINDAGQIFRENKADIKTAYGGEIPKEVQQKIDVITKERDDAIAERTKVEEKLRQKMAERGFEEIKKQAAKNSKNKETREALKKEESELINELKKAIKKDLGQANAGIPIPKETLEVLGKLAVNYVKQGVNGVEALVNKIYENVKDTDITRQQIKDAIANYEPLHEIEEVKRLNKKADLLEEKLTPPTVKTKGNSFTPSEKIDLAKPSKEYKTFRTSNEWIKANQRVANAEFRMKIEKRKAFESQKNWFQRGLAWAGRITRLSVLSGYHVLGKLASAATIGSAVKRIPEQAIGTIYAGVFKGISEKAPIEGASYLNAKSEAKFYKEFFNPKKFAKNAWEILKTGSSDLGKRLGSAEYEHVPGLYLPTDLHQIIKDPPKRATFEASFRNGLIWAEKNGLDINDPLVINSIENAAYKRAQYEIFQEQNWLSKKFTSYKSSLEKKGNVGAATKLLIDFMIPVSTVPTNIVRRIITTSPLGLIRGGKEVVEAYRKGIEKLKPEEAEHVMMQLKQGSLGTALWLIGWFGYNSFGGLYSQFNPNKKRNENDKMSDEMEVGGEMIPVPVQHALPLEVIQTAATARRIYENYKENKNATTPEALYKAGLGSIGASLEQIPVIETGVHAVMATQDPVESENLKEDIKRRFQPQILRETGIIQKGELDKSQKEWKYIEDKGFKITEPKKETINVFDKEGKKIHVSEDEFDKLKELRHNFIQEEIKNAMDNGVMDLKTETKKSIDELADNKKEFESWLMRISSDATKKAKIEVFGEQPKKAENPRYEAIKK